MKKLNDIPKQNNFKTPEGYFDSVKNEIKNKTEAEKNKEPLSAFAIFKPYIYMAASILILVGGLKFTLTNLVDKNDIYQTEVETISQTTELNDYIDEISDDDIALYEFLYEDAEEEIIAEITDDEIEEYLSDYYLEYELLYE